LHDYDTWEIQPVISGKTSNNDTLLRFLKDLSENMQPTIPVIGMFDRDVKLPIKLPNGEVDIRDKDYIAISKNVYAFALPVPHNREEVNDISIEHYFTDSEIKTEYKGKRLFLGNEFFMTGVFCGNEDLYCKQKTKLGTIKIIEHETNSFVTKTDGTGDYSLSKARFVEYIQNNIPGFDKISFSEFKRIFDVLERIFEDSQI